MASNFFKRQRLRLPNPVMYQHANVQHPISSHHAAEGLKTSKKHVSVFSSGIITVRSSKTQDNAMIKKRQSPPMTPAIHAKGIGDLPHEQVMADLKDIKRRSLAEIINIPAGRLKARMRAVADPEINNNEKPKTSEPKKKVKNAAMEEELVQAEERARLSRLPVREATCVCDRPKTTIFCRACGFAAWGRVRKQCVLHCRVSYLLDIDQCPKCNRRAVVEEEQTAEN